MRFARGPAVAGRIRALAMALLGGDGSALSARCEAIARESGGNPFFVAELVRSMQTVEELPQKPSSSESSRSTRSSGRGSAGWKNPPDGCSR